MKTVTDIQTEASQIVADKRLVIELTPADLAELVAATSSEANVLPEDDEVRRLHGKFAMYAKYPQPAPMKLSAAKVLSVANLIS